MNTEKLGVRFVFKKSSFKVIEIDVPSIDNGIMALQTNTHPVHISLINAFDPHAGYTSRGKTAFYVSLTQILGQDPPHETNPILGNFNAKSWK